MTSPASATNTASASSNPYGSQNKAIESTPRLKEEIKPASAGMLRWHLEFKLLNIFTNPKIEGYDSAPKEVQDMVQRLGLDKTILHINEYDGGYGKGNPADLVLTRISETTPDYKVVGLWFSRVLPDGTLRKHPAPYSGRPGFNTLIFRGELPTIKREELEKTISFTD